MEERRKVADMTLDELRRMVEEIADRRLRELLSDPDLGLELRKEVVERLQRSLERVRRGVRGRPLGEVARENGRP